MLLQVELGHRDIVFLLAIKELGHRDIISLLIEELGYRNVVLTVRKRTIEVLRDSEIVLSVGKELGDGGVEVLAGGTVVGRLLFQVHVEEVFSDSDVVFGLLKEFEEDWVLAHIQVLGLGNIILGLV